MFGLLSISSQFRFFFQTRLRLFFSGPSEFSASCFFFRNESGIPSRIEYRLVINNDLNSHLSEDTRLNFFAVQKIYTNPIVSNDQRGTEIHGLDTTHQKIPLEVIVIFYNFNPHPINPHSSLKFKTLLHPYITTHLILIVSDDHFFI